MFIYVKCRYSLIITNNMLYICFLSSRSFVGVSWTQSKRRLSLLPSVSQFVRPFACLFAAFVCIGSMFMVYGEWVLVSLSIDVAEYLSVYKSVFLCLCTSVYVQFYYIFLLCFFSAVGGINSPETSAFGCEPHKHMNTHTDTHIKRHINRYTHPYTTLGLCYCLTLEVCCFFYCILV